MSVVFADTVGLLALWDQSDQWHAAAAAAFDKLVRARERVTTTSFVLLECANAAARKSYRRAVNDLRIRLEAHKLLITPSDADWHAAWAEYGGRETGDAGIVDHISFVTMRRLGIQRAFTNDRHFRAAGFEILF